MICSGSVTIALVVLAGASGPLAVSLPEGESIQGVERRVVTKLATGENNAYPALAVTPAGEVLVAFVRLDGGRESIWVRKAKSALANLGKPRQVSKGYRAWHPRLAAGSDGQVWLAWSGRVGRVRPGLHHQEVFVRRIHPGPPGPVLRVSESGGRASDPELAVGEDGSVHLVWEESAPGQMHQVRIGYRALTPGGRFLAKAQILSAGPFDRRPAVTLNGRKIQVAWDSLVDRGVSGAADPDYDVFVRTRLEEKWGRVTSIDTRPGIQAAPSLAVDRDGCLLVAYHSSHRHSLVKWWELRRVCDQTIEGLTARDPAGEREPFGEQQGAEFPELVVLPGGRLAVISRPSQGAYLQLIDRSGVSPPLDLTRRGWGARGMRAQAQPGPDGSVLAVRRARHGCVLEQFFIQPDSPGRPEFKSLMGPGTKSAQVVTRSAPRKVLYGDPHMHSAASDGTGPPDEVYARAWTRGLDFAALTDHDYLVGSPRFPSSFDEIAWVTDAFDALDGFTTLHAYEWTTPPVPKGHGHRNVYFRGAAPAAICGSKSGCPDSSSLFAALQKDRAIAIPHHTTWTGTDWDAADPDIQKQFEIVSVHGACEYPGNRPVSSRGNMEGMFALDGLRRGLKFGFVGGSDAHGLRWHHGIGRSMDPWRQGITGVIAEGNRAAIFDAIKARRTFATSGATQPVFLEVGSLPMGAEGTLAAPVEGTYRAEGYQRIEVLRDGKTIHQAASLSGKIAGKFTDADLQPGEHFYYMRAVSAGSVAWTSPVFVTVTSRGRAK